MCAAGRAAWSATLLALLGACTFTRPGTPSLPPREAALNPERFAIVTVANVSSAARARAGSTPRGYDGVPQYGSTAPARWAVQQIEREHALQPVAEWPIASLGVHCVLVRLPAGSSSLPESLQHDPRIESAQPLNTFRTLGAEQPLPWNDPYAGLQHALRELDLVRVPAAVRGRGIRIAVIDTGIDVTHPDLRGQVLDAANFVDGDPAVFRGDHHGTAVAGVIAALENNGIGIVGIAPEARLLARKACWEERPGQAAVCNSFTLAQAIESALRGHADIVNLSLSGPPDPLVQRLIEAGLRRGVIFIAAVPPDGRPGFPAAQPGVVPVAAPGAAFGSRGLIGITAPASDILTLTPGGHYDFVSGSSLAAAEVSGVVALMLSADRRLDATAVRRALEQAATPAGESGGAQGIDACAALRFATHREVCAAPR